MATEIEIANARLSRRLIDEVKARPTATLEKDPLRLARHEAGHAVAMFACGGRAESITYGSVQHGYAARADGTVNAPRGDDDLWTSAVVLWAGGLAAGTLIGAAEDLGKMHGQYLTGRDETSAFYAARLIVKGCQAELNTIVAELRSKRSLDRDDLQRLAGHVTGRPLPPSL